MRKIEDSFLDWTRNKRIWLVQTCHFIYGLPKDTFCDIDNTKSWEKMPSLRGCAKNMNCSFSVWKHSVCPHTFSLSTASEAGNISGNFKFLFPPLDLIILSVTQVTSSNIVIPLCATSKTVIVSCFVHQHKTAGISWFAIQSNFPTVSYCSFR